MIKGTVIKTSHRTLKCTSIVHKHQENIFKLNVDKGYGKTTSSENKKLNVNTHVSIKNVLDSVKENNIHTNAIKKKVVIDFSSPNIAKPFHVGHLRSTIIGNFIANINKYYNNDVVKINYLGDWGTQFGLLQYGLDKKNINIDEIKNNPIKNLYHVYVETNKLSSENEGIQYEARKYFTDIEQGKANLDGWKRIREITINEFENVYNRLGIKFDEYHWESNYNGNAIKHVIQDLETKNILITDEAGKKIAKVNNRNVAVVKSDNSTLYLTRDIAALLDRYEKFKFDKMLYVVDNSQTDHFAALFGIVKQINNDCTNGCEHVKFGRIRGMSTRKGNVVFLNNILDEAKQRMFDKQRQSKSKV